MSDCNNQDRENVEHFNKLSEEWWDPAGPMRTLHWLNPIRMDYIKQHIELDGKLALDVGCGAGLVSEELAKAGATVDSIDMAADLIQVASKHADENSLTINYQNTNVEEFVTGKNAQYDVITCLELLEHVPDPQAIVSACSKALKPGGTVFFSTINRNLRSFLEDIVAAEYILQMVPKGSHTYSQLIKPSELNNMCEAAGLKSVDFKGFDFNLFKKSFSLRNSLATNYIMVARKCQ